MQWRFSLVLLFPWALLVCVLVHAQEEAAAVQEQEQKQEDEEPHPDPNEEHYDNMIYLGRLDADNARVGFHQDNGIKFIFGTSFDETHKQIEERDLEHYSPHHDMPDRNHPTKTREEALRERRHDNISQEGPKPFGHVDEHPLDGGVVPPKIVHVEPFFMDATLVTNKDFGKFVRSTYYETEAQHFGWSFVLESFLSSDSPKEEVDPQAEHWVAVQGAYWRRPEGPNSTYKLREHHPVTHVSHRDAAEYCAWAGKRLPGEREWEAAARARHWGPKNRTLYTWGEDNTWEVASQYANLWGSGTFPYQNHAEDKWRGTSPIKTYPPNRLGFYDMTGNVWEWMRGGKHKKRIVRGGSFVDSLDGSYNHAATLGARATLHGTTTTGNVGFRCVKSPRRKTEYHYVSHDESVHGELAIEDQYGKRVPDPGWEDVFTEDELWMDEFDPEDQDMERPNFKLKKVIKKRERISTEL
jgi:formylglycine-generating enzyme required for sulfatase activity